MSAITHARVLKIAAPVVLSNATVPLLGAVDTAVIGQMGQAAPLGAVGMGAIILATLYWAFGFLRMSTSGLAAQAQGAGDMAERTAVLLRALAVAVAAGFVLIAAQGLLFAGAFAVSPASAEVEGLAREYLGIRIWGARTLSQQAAWRYINVRRIFLTAGRWIERNMTDVLFEPNTPELWGRIVRDLTMYFTELLEQGALAGRTAQEAFYVKCDAETNPHTEREIGHVVTEIGLAPAATAEFIVMRLIHGPSGVCILGPT